MTEEEYRKQNNEYENTLDEDSSDIESFVAWGDMLVEWAEQIQTDSGDAARGKAHITDADEKYQMALAIDETLVDVYGKLSAIYFRRAELEDPSGGKPLLLEAALFEMGAGSCLVLSGDNDAAKLCFQKSFETLRDWHQLAPIPFTFKLGLDFLSDREEKKYVYAAKRLLPSSETSGHEEMFMILRAITDGRLEQAAKQTLAARASFEIARKIVKG